MKKKNTPASPLKKLRRTKRYNGVYDPEFEPLAEVMLQREMTGAVPAAPQSEAEAESYEELAQGVRLP